ncbi:MAG TPA: branched-chain amino acid ABC transporter permease, partial [Pseudoalteromonas shioyasakiensis]|nr:branched-chain amino acid ABC transporter permease [Pseudoalteromonas shioyasakiensis]
GVKNLATLATVITAGVVATLLKSQGFQLWLVTAALIAMTVGYLISRLQAKEEHTQ